MATFKRITFAILFGAAFGQPALALPKMPVLNEYDHNCGDNFDKICKGEVDRDNPSDAARVMWDGASDEVKAQCVGNHSPGKLINCIQYLGMGTKAAAFFEPQFSVRPLIDRSASPRLPPLTLFDACADVGHNSECVADSAKIALSIHRVVRTLWEQATPAARAKCTAASSLAGDMISCLESN